MYEVYNVFDRIDMKYIIVHVCWSRSSARYVDNRYASNGFRWYFILFFCAYLVILIDNDLNKRCSTFAYGE
jgi:hypothetical protein